MILFVLWNFSLWRAELFVAQYDVRIIILNFNWSSEVYEPG